jgi:hypothetical protein
MGRFSICVYCNACGSIHSMERSVTLDYDSTAMQSIADTYTRPDLIPQNLIELKNNHIFCPKTGRHYKQGDYHRIYLVPVRD